MSELPGNPSFHLWCYTAIALFAKMFGNSLVQGIVRLKTRQYTRPDDAKFFGRSAPVAQHEHPVVDLAAACWRNDLENIPMFLILGLGYVLAGAPASRATLFFGGFLIARVLHTVLYLHPCQPWRNIAYLAGTLATASVAVHLVMLLRA